MAAIPGEPRDYSGSITTGGTSQTLVDGNLGRMYLFIQNVSSADLWINFGAVAAEPDSPSIKIQPDVAIAWESGLGFVPSSSITIYGALTGASLHSQGRLMGLSGAKPSPLKVLTDPASATVTYVGWAAPGTPTSAPAWKVVKLDFTGGGLSMLWPITGAEFSYVWDDRATETYS